MPNNSQPILAAMQFDEQQPHLVEAALSLAQRFSQPLALINVYTEPQPIPDLDVPLGFETLSKAMALDFQASLTRQREQMRSFLSRTNAGSVSLRGDVVVGGAASAILEEAKQRDAKLIMTACSPGAYSLMPRGFSVAIALMAQANVPVLAVSDRGKLVFPRDRRFRILVCDDLEPGSLGAVRTAYEWATRLANVALTQLHIHGDLREVLQDYWSDLVAHTPYLKERFATPEALWSEHERERLAALQARAGQPGERAHAAGVAITQSSRFANNIREEIKLTIEESAPDLIVFGRHKLLKPRPFMLGRLPFHTMLEFECPILVVPPQD